MPELTSEELAAEFSTALERVSKLAMNSMMKDDIRPVTVTFDDGVAVTITCYDTPEYLEGNGKLHVDLCVPREYIDTDTLRSSSYVRENYESDSIDMIHDVIQEMFGHEASFFASESTETAIVFSDSISSIDPTLLPTDDEIEIIPVVNVSVEKRWVAVKDGRRPNLRARQEGDDVELTLKPSENDVDVGFGETVEMFGTELSVKNTDNGLALMKDNEIVAYVSESLEGGWTELVNAGGDF